VVMERQNPAGYVYRVGRSRIPRRRAPAVPPELYGGPFPGIASTVQPPIVWTSPDGRAWERRPFDGDGIGSLNGATIVDGTLVLVGQVGGFDGEAGAWTVDLG
jgi:hypothetical protein